MCMVSKQHLLKNEQHCKGLHIQESQDQQAYQETLLKIRIGGRGSHSDLS